MIEDDCMVVQMTKKELTSLIASEVEKAVAPMLAKILTIVSAEGDPDNDICEGAEEISKRLHVSTATLTKMVRSGELEGIVHKHRNTFIASRTKLAAYFTERNN